MNFFCRIWVENDLSILVYTFIIINYKYLKNVGRGNHHFTFGYWVGTARSYCIIIRQTQIAIQLSIRTNRSIIELKGYMNIICVLRQVFPDTLIFKLEGPLQRLVSLHVFSVQRFIQ